MEDFYKKLWKRLKGKRSDDEEVFLFADLCADGNGFMFQGKGNK